MMAYTLFLLDLDDEGIAGDTFRWLGLYCTDKGIFLIFFFFFSQSRSMLFPFLSFPPPWSSLTRSQGTFFFLLFFFFSFSEFKQVIGRQGRAGQGKAAKKKGTLKYTQFTAVGEEDDRMIGTEKKSEKGRTKQ